MPEPAWIRNFPFNDKDGVSPEYFQMKECPSICVYNGSRDWGRQRNFACMSESIYCNPLNERAFQVVKFLILCTSMLTVFLLLVVYSETCVSQIGESLHVFNLP